MRLFGLELTVRRPGTQVKAAQPAGLLSTGSNGWWPIIRESFTGAWQRNITVDQSTALAYSAVFSCVTLISGDIGKICLRLVQKDADGIWNEADNPAWSPVLRRPNGYQNRIQFLTQWVISKLVHGNTYVLKVRDQSRRVAQMYILDPCRVKPLVAPNGDVYYDLSTDYLSGIEGRVIVPASEIIHDRWNCLFHPLVGLSPIYACGVAAVQGLNIQNSSAKFFANGARPAGVLTAPGHIEDDTAERLKAHWEEKFSGEGIGGTAVLGDGLNYQAMTMTSVDAQLIEQLKWSAETVCACFHVPAYMAGVGAIPLNNNVESLREQYYAQCLQVLIEAIELCLDEGLGLNAGTNAGWGTEFDLDALLRMDQASQITALAEGVKGGLFRPNEGRKKLNYGPVEGGDQVYLQQQNYSLMALAKRDAKDDPFAKGDTPALAAPDAQLALPPPAKSLSLAEIELEVRAFDLAA